MQKMLALLLDNGEEAFECGEVLYSGFEGGDEDFHDRCRAICKRCSRPMRVCVCAFLPETPLVLSTPIVLLQHPHEAKRKLQTAALLELCINPQWCKLYRCRSIGPVLASPFWIDAVEHQGRTPLLLFPREGAMGLSELQASLESGARYCLVVLDGTWREANELLRNSGGRLSGVRTLDIGEGGQRQGLFAARKPPRDGCVSTLEAVAYTMETLEPDPVTAEKNVAALLRPMLRMAQQQVELTSLQAHHSNPSIS